MSLANGIPDDAIFVKDQQCRQVFISLLRASGSIQKTRIGDSYDRYKIWAINVGASHSGKSYKRSLDYRLREALVYRGQIITVMIQLFQLLTESLSYITGKIENDLLLSSEESSEEEINVVGQQTVRWTLSDSEEDPTHMKDTSITHNRTLAHRQETGLDWFTSSSKLEATLRSIELAVSCLYRIPVREPASIDRLKRYQKFDNFDFSVYAHFDRMYVRDLHSQADSRIVMRLARMITERRRRLRYILSHNRELQKQYTEFNPEPGQNEYSIPKYSLEDLVDAAETELASPTERQLQTIPRSSLKASTFRPKENRLVPVEQFLSEPRFDVDEVSSIAPTAVEAGKLTLPPRPRDEDGEELTDFICPYCGIPKHLKSSSAWKKHVLADLQPYVCTYVRCNEPDHMFSNRREWFMHESQHHHVLFCGTDGHEQHESLDAFCGHMRAEHCISLMRDGDPARLEPFQRRKQQIDGQCKLCWQHTDHLEHHVGQHLERLALFSIPRSHMTTDETMKPLEDSNLSISNTQGSRKNDSILDSDDALNDSNLDLADNDTDVASDLEIVPDTAFPDDWQSIKPELGLYYIANRAHHMAALNSQDTAETGRCTQPDCGLRVKDLTAHMLIHQAERSEKCPIVACEYYTRGFHRKSDRNRHVLIHYRSSMVCNFCSNSRTSEKSVFNRVDVFKRHLVDVHDAGKGAAGNGQSSPKKPSKSDAEFSRHGTVECSTCDGAFENVQNFYSHLDECILSFLLLEQRARTRAEPIPLLGTTVISPNSEILNPMRRQSQLIDLLMIFYPGHQPEERSQKIVLIRGLFGVGKTCLVQDYIRIAHTAYVDGIFWVDGSSGAAANDCVRQIWTDTNTGGAFDEQGDPMENMRSVLVHRKQWLMIVDGADGPDLNKFIRALLTYEHILHGHVIVTSRRIPDQRRLTEVVLQPLSRSDNARAIYTRLGITKPTSKQEQKVDEIFQFTQGLPLALSAISDSLIERGLLLEDCNLQGQLRILSKFINIVASIDDNLRRCHFQEAADLIIVLSYWGPIIPFDMVKIGLRAADELEIELRCSATSDNSTWLDQFDPRLSLRTLDDSIKILMHFGLVELTKLPSAEFNAAMRRNTHESTNDTTDRSTTAIIKIIPAIQKAFHQLNFKSSVGGRGPSWLVVSILIFCRSLEMAQSRIPELRPNDAYAELDAYREHAKTLSGHAEASRHDISIHDADTKLSNANKYINVMLRTVQRYTDLQRRDTNAAEDTDLREHTIVSSQTRGKKLVLSKIAITSSDSEAEKPGAIADTQRSTSANLSSPKKYRRFKFKKYGPKWDTDITVEEVLSLQSRMKDLVESRNEQDVAFLRSLQERRAQIDHQTRLLDAEENDGSTWEPVYIYNTKLEKRQVEKGGGVKEFEVIFASNLHVPRDEKQSESADIADLPESVISVASGSREDETPKLQPISVKVDETPKQQTVFRHSFGTCYTCDFYGHHFDPITEIHKPGSVAEPSFLVETLQPSDLTVTYKADNTSLPIRRASSTLNQSRPVSMYATPNALPTPNVGRKRQPSNYAHPEPSQSFAHHAGPIGRSKNTGVVSAAAENKLRQSRSQTRRSIHEMNSPQTRNIASGIGQEDFEHSTIKTLPRLGKDTRFYDILGVAPDASSAELLKAHRRGALKYHPDRISHETNAVDKFKDLTRAFEILYDPRTRQIYDQHEEGPAIKAQQKGE